MSSPADQHHPHPADDRSYGQEPASTPVLAPVPVDVISVQSQVVYGSVGNSVAVPALQAAGLSVVAVPTVLLSNTPHYDSLHGGAVPLEWFEGFLKDLERRGATRTARAVLIGYLGSPDQADVLADWLERVMSRMPDIMVVLDPVMGDHDSGVYVNPKLPPVRKARLLPLATGLTPNSFEFERLVGTDVSSVDATVEAAKGLLGNRTKWVVITSAAPDQQPEGGSRIVVVAPEGYEVVNWNPLETPAKGTGDLFSAAVTSRLLVGQPLVQAVTNAHQLVARVVAGTADLACKELVFRSFDLA